MQIPFKKIRTNFLKTLFFALIPFVHTDAQPVKLIADKSHSTVGFSVAMMQGLTRVTGKYTDFEIIITYKDSDITKSSIEANIKAESINTGIAGRDQHLATPDFFDAAKFPLITFKSDSITKNGNGYIAHGSFSMHGINKKIQLPFTIVGKNGEGSVGFTSRYTIKRRDYLIGKDTLKPEGDGMLSDDVMVEIDFIAEKPKGEK